MTTKARLLLGVLILMSLLAYLAVFASPPETANWLTHEDHLYENIQAAGFLLASILFFILYLRDQSGNDFMVTKTRKNVFLLALALMFFFGFGEEISWGQRIFRWQTPAQLKEMNVQGETTIHNLKLFDARGAQKSFWDDVLNYGRVYAVFCSTFCFAIPLLDRSSRFLSKLIRRLNIPLVPLWLGVWFPLNSVTYKFLELYCPNSLRRTPSEVKETVFAILFAGVSIWFLTENRNHIESIGAREKQIPIRAAQSGSTFS